MPTPAKTRKKTTTPTKPSASTATAAARRMKRPEYKSFRLTKRIRHPNGPLRGSFRMFWANLKHLRKYWWVFIGITLVYAVLTLVLVSGFTTGLDLGSLKDELNDAFEADGNSWLAGITLFGVLLGSAGSTASEVAAAYQTMLIIIMSLAVIWALRQTHAGTKVTIRDAFYRGMYPLVPFLLVLFVIGLQLLPLAVAGLLYSIVIEGGLAITGLEIALWLVILSFIVLLSLYMLTSSLFALYIVTLPDMTPMKALRSAREVVRFRRWTIMRKVFFLPIALLVIAAVIMIPVIMFATPVAEGLFVVMSMAALVIFHGYMYTLYRELL